MSRPLAVRSRPASAALLPFVALLRAWLGAGVLICALIPASAWYNPWIGWLPYWLIVMPLVPLLLLQRQRMAAALGAILVRARRRRPSAVRRPRPVARGRLRVRTPAMPLRFPALR